ncbi:MAG: hypothetical protein M3371_02385 [Acidobacteriota bacterium]|nr:hypothetical protein [Acidobacteriota bacterium]
MKRKRILVRFLLSQTMLLALFASGLTQAQAQAQPQTENKPMPTTESKPTTPAAKPADVASIDAILAAVYDTISGPAGQPRDWDRFRSLFVPGARLIPTVKRPDGEFVSRVLDVEMFIRSATENTKKQGFYEKAIANRIEQFANMAHVFSTYEARHNATDAKPFIRGINSIQLMNDGQRWWAVTIFWQAEDAVNLIPQKYLKD